MKYESFMEALKGKQKKLDKNHNGELDAQDFKILRKEETEELDEIHRMKTKFNTLDPVSAKSVARQKLSNLIKSGHGKGALIANKMRTLNMGDDIDQEDLEALHEVLSKDAEAGDWIHDFVHSTNPKFEGKTKKERIKMALGAYYAKQRTEEVELTEDKMLPPVHKKVMSAAGNHIGTVYKYDKPNTLGYTYGASYHPHGGRGGASGVDWSHHNDPEKAEKTIHRQHGLYKSAATKAVQKAEKHKASIPEEVELRESHNVEKHYNDWVNSENAPDHHDAGDDNKIHASAMRHLHGSMTVPKEDHDELAWKMTDKYHGIKENAPVAPVPPGGYVVKYHNSKGEHENTSKMFYDKNSANIHANKGNGMDKVGGKYTVHAVDAKGHDINEGRNEGDVPFDKPYKTVTSPNIKDKSGAVHTPMSLARHIARMARDAQAKSIKPIQQEGNQKYKGLEQEDKPGKIKTAVVKLHPNGVGSDTVEGWKDAKKPVEEAVQKADIPAYLRKAKGDTPLKMDDLKRKDTISDKDNLARNRGTTLTKSSISPGETVLKTNEETDKKISYKEFMEGITVPTKTGYRHIGTYGTAKGAKYGNTDYDKETLDTKDDEGSEQPKRGRGRPAGAKSGARKITGTSKLYK